MKIWLHKLSILCLFSVVLFSCEKDEDEFVTVTAGDAPTLNASETTVVLQEDQAEEEAITFSWTPLDVTWSDPEVSHSNAATYFLEFDTAEDNFASPQVVRVGNATERVYTAAQLNALLNQLELTPGEAGDVVVRLRTVLGDNLDPYYSNVMNITATPWLDKPNFPTVYMVGDATEFDWDAANATPVFRSTADPFTFIYTGYLQEGALKFLQNRGEWAPQWGSDGTATGVAARPTETDPDPAAFTVPADGYYTVVLDLRDNIFAIEPFDASGAEVYESIGIIGAFNEWTDPVVPLTNSEFNPHYWTTEYTFASDTELKFRIAEGWDVNWGTGAVVSEDPIYSEGVLNGPNIVVPAGTYRIIFNDLTGRYLFIEQE
ncbi:uncharacterized protein DUF5019 [Pontibacter ummariensis]|uniref:SusE outer membrane protein domain-containing protein n=1 Tax=Pontibacter ummariensis TaxID=1610492 RepID=A0A239I8B1_9BACT|nr:SusE domain-containing protein [Pontibacter ummariensis]PRY09999.1 uncharacterized protein DUF5019 [Pontibacter ummariensis]SNS89622.1 protein of unknown function [Pontibacter ummariensis]